MKYPGNKETLPGLRLLFIGGGAVVAEYYLPALHMLQSLSKVLVVDNSSLIHRYDPDIRLEKRDWKSYFANFFDKESFDAAIIALPNSLHAEAAELALTRGLHVLCEKPLAMDEQSCLRLGKLAQEKGKVLSVGMVRRFLPSVIALRQALKVGMIGQLKSVEIEDGAPYAWLSDSGSYFQTENGGLLADMGVHYLDLVEEVAGSLTPMDYHDDCRGGIEANFEYLLNTQNGIPVRLKLSRTHELKNTAMFRGELGDLVLEKNTFGFCFWRSHPSDGLMKKLYPEKPFQGGQWSSTLHSCFAEQLFHFEKSIHGNGTSYVTAFQASKTMRLISWAYENRSFKRKTIKKANLGKAAVTGSTGFIGGRLIARLSETDEYEIAALLRNYKTCADIARFPIQMHRVNLLDYEQVKKAIQGARFVFHLAYGNQGPDAERVTVQGTKNVVNAAIACGTEGIVVLSTMYVFGYPNTDRHVDETWPYMPTGGEYGLSKAKMERWCLKRARTSGDTRIVVLNPTCVFGPGGKTYTRLPLQLASEGKFCWIEDGKGIANYTYVENLVDAMLRAISCKEAHGQRFIINDGFCSWKEFLMPLLGPLGKTLPSFSQKELSTGKRSKKANVKEMITHLASDMEFIEIINGMPLLGPLKRFLFKRLPKLHSSLLEARSQKREVSIGDNGFRFPPEWLGDLFGPTKTIFYSGKAQNVLSWKPKVDFKEGMKQTTAWLESIGSYPSHPKTSFIVE